MDRTKLTGTNEGDGCEEMAARHPEGRSMPMLREDQFDAHKLDMRKNH